MEVAEKFKLFGVKKEKASIPARYRSSLIRFVAGAAFGLTSVAVGQPFDTIKTRIQSTSISSKVSTVHAFSSLFQKEGIRGFYRGMFPLAYGSVFFRSAQFGCYDAAFTVYQSYFGKSDHYYFGFFNPQVVLAGMFGGVARSFIEAPLENIKVRQQAACSVKFSRIFDGCFVTLLRNSLLVGSFIGAVDFQDNVLHWELSPFLKGASSGTLAWILIFPIDVLKSKIQSGNNEGLSSASLFYTLFRTGNLFRGCVSGLLRCIVANGSSFYVFNKVNKYLERTI